MSNTKGSPGRASSNPVMGLQEWLLLGVLSVLWGGSFVFVGVIVRECRPRADLVRQAERRHLARVAHPVDGISRDGRGEFADPLQPHRLGSAAHRQRARAWSC